MNRVILSGWINFDVELKTTSNGVPVVSNVIGVKNKYKNADGKYKYNNIRFTAYRNNAEFLDKYVRKGDKVIIEGDLDVYVNNGNYLTSVIVRDIEIAQKKQEKSSNEFGEGFTEIIDEPF